MRNDMTSVLFQRSAGRRKTTRRRFNIACPAVSRCDSTPEKVVQMNFRLGEEPDNCRVLRYLSARHIGNNGGWVTAEVVIGGAVRSLGDPHVDSDLDTIPVQEPMRTKRSRYDEKELKLN